MCIDRYSNLEDRATESRRAEDVVNNVGKNVADVTEWRSRNERFEQACLERDFVATIIVITRKRGTRSGHKFRAERYVKSYLLQCIDSNLVQMLLSVYGAIEC